MKKKITLAAAAVVLVLIIGAAVFWFWKGKAKTDDNVVYVNSVESITGLGSGNGMQNRYSGEVESQQTWSVNKTDGQTIEQILVTEGQEVKTGDPLVTYDMSTAQTELNQAQLDIDRLNTEIESLNGQIKTLEEEKKTVSSDQQLEYTIRIQTAQTDIKKDEYEIKSKQATLEKLQDTVDNATVTSQIDGVVQSINTGDSTTPSSDGTQALITILKTGQFRIKGMVNEQNIQSITQGASVIIRSRKSDDATWKGTISEIDMESPQSASSADSFMVDSSSDSSTGSSKYPFYVELESSENLMLGQHVYIEMDQGQDEQKDGIWLDDYYIMDVDTDPYVWADNGKGKLEKRKITLGEHDETLLKYEITDGLAAEDLITFPEDGLEEGMTTELGEAGQMGQSNPTVNEVETTDETEVPADAGEVENIPEAVTGPEDAEIVTDEEGPAGGEEAQEDPLGPSGDTGAEESSVGPGGTTDGEAETSAVGPGGA